MKVRVQLFLDEQTWDEIVEICMADNEKSEVVLKWAIGYGLQHIRGIKKLNGQAVLHPTRERSQ